jgi:hypothetical protein
VTTADVEQQINAAIDAFVAAAQRIGHPDIAKRLTEPLRTVWTDLNALPRSDAVWSQQPNHHASIYKVATYARQRVAHDPSDRLARRALVAVALQHGSNDAGLPHLTVDVAEDVAAVGDAVIVARWIWLETGSDTTPYLRQTLAAADQAALQALARNTQGWTKRAAQIAHHEAYERHAPGTS